MRPRLLLSRLPTVWESWEEMLPGGPRQERPASPGVDDYVRSIHQLAQPTSVLNEAAARARPSRPPRSARACAKSCPSGSLQDVTTRVSSQQPPRPGTSTDDPLDWLFGQSQEKQPRCRDLPRTGPSADRWGLHRQMQTSKAQGCPKGKLCDARAPGHSLVRPLRDRHQSSWASWQPVPAAASPPSSRPSSVLRTFYLHLPVIHEL